MNEADFGLSASDDDLDNDDRILLDEMKKNPGRKYAQDSNSVFNVDDDEDEDDGGEELSDIDMDSDIEDKQDDLPDDRAWGQKRKNFYNTDYVDKDYSGFYNEEEAEAAELEEQEARNIQKRLMEQLSDADFSLADFTEKSYPSEEKSETIETDLSALSKRQKLELFRKESPEFDNLVNDFEAKMNEAREKILPVLKLIENGTLSQSSAGDFLKTKYRLILNYCTNIVFYVLLKTKRISVRDHPVLKALFRYRQLLNQLRAVDDEIIAPQVAKIMQGFINTSDESTKKKKKKVLRILKKSTPKQVVEQDDEKSDSEAELMELKTGSQTIEQHESHEKRAITYEMAKNKGLTPKRKKEQRNPRVKHRNKYRKAIVRRRGQVRTVRKEIPVYGGEPSGIKIGLKKGRKFK